MTPALHFSIADAHLHASQLFMEVMAEAKPVSLLSVADRMQCWWHRVGETVLLPLNASRITDLIDVLSELRRPASSFSDPAPMTEEETALWLTEWEDWLWMSCPRLISAPTSDLQAQEAGMGASSAGGMETLAYAEMTGLLYSYGRHHRGVQWGASRPDDADSVASFHRRVYRLHPWHAMYCPEGYTQQRPHVHLLQWMLAGKESPAQPSEELWRRHRAVEAFNVRSVSDESNGFKALDVGSQSGFGVDLLLKAGAAAVMAVDAQVAALGSTEATFHEHLNERRSRRRGQILATRRCDNLPAASPSIQHRRTAGEAGGGNQKSRNDAAASHTLSDAAERRRRQARLLGRGYAAAPMESPSERRGDGDQSPTDGPYDVIYLHPPAPTTVWPVMAMPMVPHRHSRWWSLVEQKAAVHGIEKAAVLPSLICSSSEWRQHPLATWTAMQNITDALRREAGRPSTSVATEEGASDSPALLSENGYVIAVLPRTYDLDEALATAGTIPAPSLASSLILQLDGCYDVVLQRRCGMLATASAGGATADMPDAALLRHVSKMSQFGVDQPVEGELTAPLDWTMLLTQLQSLYADQLWQDVVVLKRSKHVRRAPTAVRGEGQQLQQQRRQRSVSWEDSFEFNEYKPKGGLPTQHHWTDLVPTYSYLEPDFFNKPEASLPFLAVGHPSSSITAHPAGAPVANRTDAVEDGARAASHAAAMNFNALFAEELRTKRRSKLRKLALSPLQRQEWYIDEKLVKSNAAKVQLLNDLSKWDLKDYDD